MKSIHDSNMYRKRERTQNWSLEEKMFLLELVKSRLDVLENKRIDSASSAMKGLAWQDIHAGFAARFGNDRDAHRVREQWRRMKGQSRTEMLEFAERVRTYGAEVANQRRPSALAEEVWKTLELARKLNAYHQSFGGGDDMMGSPANLDDDDDDGEDPLQWKDTDGELSYSVERRVENGLKTDMDSEMDSNHTGRRIDRVDNRVDEVIRDESGEESERSPYPGASTSTATTAGLMSMLRPKVELNDVPELDTSMVPSGLSITAVRVGNAGQKRRAVVDAPPPPRDKDRDFRDFHDPREGREEKVPANNYHSNILESKRFEQRRRVEMMEAEHQAKMALLRVERETAEVRRRIALRDEQAAAEAVTCRTCGATGRNSDVSAVISNGDKSAGPKRHLTNNRHTPSSIGGKSENGEHDNENNVDASSIVTVVSDDISQGSSSTPVIVNGAMDEDDNNNDDQVRFVGGLGEPGSGAGKGGGSGGSIRDAGGAMGKREAGLENEYFYKQQKEQLQKLKDDLTDEINFHEEQIKRHQEAIQRHKQRVINIDKEQS